MSSASATGSQPSRTNRAFQRLAAHQLHRPEVRHAIVLPYLVNRDDVRMRKRCDRPSLAQESLAKLLVGKVRPEHLQGHPAAERDVLGFEDDAHSAAADDAQDPVFSQPAEFVVGLRGGAEGKRRHWDGDRSAGRPALGRYGVRRYGRPRSRAVRVRSVRDNLSWQSDGSRRCAAAARRRPPLERALASRSASLSGVGQAEEVDGMASTPAEGPGAAIELSPDGQGDVPGTDNYSSSSIICSVVQAGIRT